MKQRTSPRARFDDAARTFTQELPTPHAKLRAIVVSLQKGVLASHVNPAAGHSRCGLGWTPSLSIAHLLRRNEWQSDAAMTGETNGPRRVAALKPVRHQPAGASPSLAVGPHLSAAANPRADATLSDEPTERSRMVGPRIADPRNLWSRTSQWSNKSISSSTAKGWARTSSLRTSSSISRIEESLIAPSIATRSGARFDRIFIVAEHPDLLAIDGRASSTGLFLEFFDEVCLVEDPRSRH
jgi:hypothetical protein